MSPNTSRPDTSRPDAADRALPRQLVSELVAAATMAPSMHNTQPWRFRSGRPPDHRPVRRSGPHAAAGRPGWPGAAYRCGAALFNLRLAAMRWRAASRCVRLLPDPGQPLLLATVRLAGPCQAQPDELELYAAIPARSTNRRPFSSQPVPPGVLAELAEAARIEGAILHFPDHQEATRLLELARDAERVLLADPAYREELARWAGGERDQEGIPDEVAGPP